MNVFYKNVKQNNLHSIAINNNFPDIWNVFSRTPHLFFPENMCLNILIPHFNQRTEGTDRKVKLFCGKTLPLSEWWKNQTVLKIRSHLSLDFNCPICYTLQPHFDDFNNEGGVVYDIYWQWQCKGDHNTLQYMSNKMFLLWIGLRSDAE